MERSNVIECICTQLGKIGITECTPNSKILGEIDSIDLVNFIMDLEEELFEHAWLGQTKWHDRKMIIE